MEDKDLLIPVHTSRVVNAMAVEDMTTHGARASAAMALIHTPF